MSRPSRASGPFVSPDVALQALPLLSDYLPADARLMAAAVCRSWRAALAPPDLWRRLTLAESVLGRMPPACVLAAASKRAAGQLEFLDISAAVTCIKAEELLAALRDNAGWIRELRLGLALQACLRPKGCSDLTCAQQTKSLVAAAPGLRRIYASGMRCAVVESALPLYACAQLAGRLRLRRLTLVCSKAADHQLTAALRDAAACEPQELCLDGARLGPQAADALADLAASAKTRSVLLWNCELLPGAASALRRLPAAPGLRSLLLCERPIDAAAAAALAQGVAASTSLHSLTFDNLELWADAEVATPLLRAAAGHPSLRKLSVRENPVRRAPGAVTSRAAGALLAAVLTTPGGALEELDLGSCKLRDEGMGPLVTALPHAVGLRRLCIADSGVSEYFAAGQLMRAVRDARRLRGDLSWRSAERSGLLRHAQVVLDNRRGAEADDPGLMDGLC